MDFPTGVLIITPQYVTNSVLENWYTAPYSKLDELFEQTYQITHQHFKRHITLYIPGSHFPSISITGTQCQLNCQHCNSHFLHQMDPVTQPTELVNYCQKLAKRNGTGCLISGGCDSDGTVPLAPFLPALTKIKQSTNLYLNVHTGFLNYTMAHQLAKTNIDCASVDVVGDERTLHEIYGLTHRSIEDYTTTLKALKSSQLSVAPHVCVGLYHGQLSGELSALQIIHSNIQPRLLVIIALMSTSGTRLANTTPVNPVDVARVCALARLRFPKCEIALGCMRPRGAVRRQMEQLAIKAGITRLVLPTRSTIKYLEENQFTLSTKRACCVV
ncbi:MAG: hypothetical protein ACFFD8_02225 [Candidatus Thorarchaeota archaeon]